MRTKVKTQSETKGKLLLIAPLFFGYYEEMIKEAENIGYCVDYICDASSNSNISKAIGRINKKLIRRSTKKYFKHVVLPKIEGVEYDCVLLVAGMTFSFSPSMMKRIKDLNPRARFVMYQWDSERNLPYSTYIHKFFDAVYSFDRYDCKAKELYIFLPLFYVENYEKIGKEALHNATYDCSYVGTAHPQKYKEINMLSEALSKQMPRQMIYHYMPSLLKYYYHKLLAPEFKHAKRSNFKFKKMQTGELMKIVANSKCILDAPQAGQTGLTIRTIECLGAKRKMVTTNSDVRHYDFYRPENILIYDGGVDDDSVFFRSNYVDLPQDIYEKYSLRNWLKTMLIKE